MRYEFEVELRPVRPKPAVQSGAQRPRVPPIQRTLVLAYQIVDYMRNNGLTTLSAFSVSAGITQSRVTQIMRVLHLSARLQERILAGDTGPIGDLSEPAIRKILKEPNWSRQEEMWESLMTTATPSN